MKSADCVYGWHEGDITTTGCTGIIYVDPATWKKCSCKCHKTDGEDQK